MDNILAYGTLSRNLIMYGKMLYNLEIEEAEGFRRVRVFEYEDAKYLHHMFNGDLVELIKL